MSFRDLCESRERPIITGEAPAFDAGGLDAFAERVAEMHGVVDAINATDGPAAHAHASNVAIAIALRQLGFEPILQVVCRDKNRIALQSDIVGAALHGIDAVCCLTGDDVTAGDEPEARRVFDLDGPQLVAVASGLAQGRYLSGRVLEPAPPLFVGAVENPAAPPHGHRAERAAKKWGAGARFLQLQICFHADRLASFMNEVEQLGLTREVAVLPTIVLVRSAGALRFMDRQVPGISVPPAIVDAVERAADSPEAAYQLALEQARHALALPGVAGVHLTDFRHDGSVARLAADLGHPIDKESMQHAHRATLAV
jgi:methylenetetrahydrofolate reductase (NADH)